MATLCPPNVITPNRMPVVSDTKVIVQSLDSLYDLLKAELSSGERPA